MSDMLAVEDDRPDNPDRERVEGRRIGGSVMIASVLSGRSSLGGIVIYDVVE